VANGGCGAVGGGGSWAVLGEATGGVDDVILLREEGRRRSGRRSAGRPRMTAAVHGEKGWGPRGRRWQCTGRRSGALADEGGRSWRVDVALLEDIGVVGGASTLGEVGAVRGAKFWHPDSVISFRAET
jgi:hypothetical protein